MPCSLLANRISAAEEKPKKPLTAEEEARRKADLLKVRFGVISSVRVHSAHSFRRSGMATSRTRRKRSGRQGRKKSCQTCRQRR